MLSSLTPNDSDDGQVLQQLICDFNDSGAQNSHDLDDSERATSPQGSKPVRPTSLTELIKM